MKIAVVTGASSGIGKEFARRLSELHSVEEVWLVARRRERMEALAEEMGVPCRILSLDLTKREDLERYRTVLQEHQPEIRYLVNASGFGKFGGYEDLTIPDTEDMIDLNDKAVVMMTVFSLPYMKAGAHIIEMVSSASFQPLPNFSIYSATKAFLLNYSLALSEELKPRRITVTAVCPGWVRTEFFETAKRDAAPGKVKRFLFLSNPQDVVRTALVDTCAGRRLSIHGIPTKLQHIIAKVVPAPCLMKAWLWMQK